MRKIKYSQALSEGIVQSMERDPNIFMTGIAVDYPSGIFRLHERGDEALRPRARFRCACHGERVDGIAIGAAAVASGLSSSTRGTTSCSSPST